MRYTPLTAGLHALSVTLTARQAASPAHADAGLYELHGSTDPELSTLNGNVGGGMGSGMGGMGVPLTGPRSGEHSLAHGHVRGSPFALLVAPGATAAARSVAHGRGLATVRAY